MAGIIDTSVLITLERRSALLGGAFPELRSDSYFISSITVSELLTGVYRARSIEQRASREQAVMKILDLVPTLPFGFAEARVHAETQSEMAANGQRIGAHDMIIAATALTHDHYVLTHNVRDFARVPGLEIKTVDW